MAIVSAARATALLLAVATLPANSKPVALGTYDDLVWDKYLVIFYHTWWCGEDCKAARPAWDALEAALRDERRVFVGEIDCADFTEVLCGNLSKREYPQIAHGFVGTKLAPYDGETDEASLVDWARTALLPEIAKLPPPRPKPRPEPAKPKLTGAELKKLLTTDLFEL